MRARIELPTAGPLLALAVFAAVLAGCASAPPGVRYSSTRTAEPQSIHWIEVEPSRVRLVAAVGGEQVLGKEKPSSMARRHGADAAVNGGFFVVRGPFAGDFQGLFVWNGRLLSEPIHQRSSFAFCADGRVWIDRFSLTTEVHLGDWAFRVAGINRRRLEAETVLFTPEFGPTTLNEGPELVVAHGKLGKVTNGGSSIPADGFVLALDQLPSDVEPGGEVRLEHRLAAQPSGVTLPELAGFLKEHGAHDAYNLDGGGSSTMIVDGKIVNSPSDAQGERPSSDAILIKVH